MDAAALLGRLGEKSSVRMIAGSFAGMDGHRTLVSFENGTVPVSPASEYRPAIDEPVWVALVDGRPYFVGPTRSLPVVATVVSSDADYVTVDTGSDELGEVDATYTDGATLTAGQEVRLLWGGEHPHVVAVMSTTPTVAAPTPVAAAKKTYEKTFTAIDAGSYGASWWTTEVWSSVNNLGAWFYGTKIADTIPSSAEALAISIYLPARQIFGDPSSFGLHSFATKPGSISEASIGSNTAIAPVNGWKSLPTSWVNSLKAGGGSRGVGIEHGGYHIFRSIAADPQSGALRIKYRA